jgi:hypothetical protein
MSEMRAHTREKRRKKENTLSQILMMLIYANLPSSTSEEPA